MPAIQIDQCPQGHEIRSSADRDGQGYCRECRRTRARDQRVKHRAALDAVRSLEAAGIRFENDGVPIDGRDVARQLVRVYGAEIDVADGY